VVKEEDSEAGMGSGWRGKANGPWGRKPDAYSCEKRKGKFWPKKTGEKGLSARGKQDQSSTKEKMNRPKVLSKKETPQVLNNNKEKGEGEKRRMNRGRRNGGGHLSQDFEAGEQTRPSDIKGKRVSNWAKKAFNKKKKYSCRRVGPKDTKNPILPR